MKFQLENQFTFHMSLKFVLFFGYKTINRMKNVLWIMVILSNGIACKSPIAKDPSLSIEKKTIVYDSTIANQWGADDYGMKSYVLVLLKRGPNRTQDSIKREELQAAHMANITKLANEGKLLVAGPMVDTGAIRGIYLFDVRTVEEAKKLTETDPAIQAGSLIMEMHPWYGSAAMMEIPRLHKMGTKKKF